MKKLSPNLTSLVTLLNDGLYHDGTTIGSKLGITRAAVWKTIQKLEGYGVEIDSIKGKGYALLDPLILLDETAITKKLNLKNADLDIFESIGSTQDYLRAFCNRKTPKFCMAEQQTFGRGRFNRTWHSPFAQNIYLSAVFPFQKDMSELAGLSIVVSLAIMRALSGYDLGEDLHVKWPNDIIFKQKKLGGCLVEVIAESNGTCYTIIGIGLNANMRHDPDKQILQPWTSLRNILNTYIDRNQLTIALINHLHSCLHDFSESGLAPFIDEWKKSDGLLDKTVMLKNENHKVHGIAKGINQHGHILLELADGSLKALSSGDTTVSK